MRSLAPYEKLKEPEERPPALSHHECGECFWTARHRLLRPERSGHHHDAKRNTTGRRRDKSLRTQENRATNGPGIKSSVIFNVRSLETNAGCFLQDKACSAELLIGCYAIGTSKRSSPEDFANVAEPTANAEPQPVNLRRARLSRALPIRQACGDRCTIL